MKWNQESNNNLDDEEEETEKATRTTLFPQNQVHTIWVQQQKSKGVGS